MYVLIILPDFFRLIKHISMCEWRRREGEKEINPTELTKEEGERAFCPHWTKGAMDALHKASESYLVGMMKDTSLLAMHNSTHGHPVGPPYPWRQRLGQVDLPWSILVQISMLTVNCELFLLLFCT